MKITIAKEIGGVKYKFESEQGEGKEMETLAEAGFLGAMPTKCKLCDSENVHLVGNRAKSYLFVKMLCKDCNARSQVGQYKDGGFFWKAWEKYVAPAQSDDAPTPTEEG